MTVIDLKRCGRCGNNFLPRNKLHTRFCSKQCHDGKKELNLICNGCGSRFNTIHKRKYCSRQCWVGNAKKWKYAHKICLTCKKEFKPRSHWQKFCGKDCKKYRNHSDNKFYQTKEWKIIRAAFKLVNPFCVECLKKGEYIPVFAVDHIVRIKDGGDKTGFSNLQSLCKKHHQSKSASEGNKRYAILN